MTRHPECSVCSLYNECERAYVNSTVYVLRVNLAFDGDEPQWSMIGIWGSEELVMQEMINREGMCPTTDDESFANIDGSSVHFKGNINEYEVQRWMVRT